MKYLKLILLFIFFISIKPVFADDLLTPDNTATVTDIEPLKIDLESLKKKSKIQKPVTAVKKKKTAVRSGKVKTGGNAAIKKKSTSKQSKSGGKTATQQKKKALIVKKSNLKSYKKNSQTKKNDIKIVKENVIVNDSLKKNDILSGNMDKSSVAIINESEKRNIAIEKKETASVLQDIIIINPSYTESAAGRLYRINSAEISKWSKPKGLILKEDAPPVVDGIAFYTPDFFGQFKVDGYDRSRNYKLYIDFVRFSGEIKPVNSLLKIWGRDLSGKMFLIASLNQVFLAEDKIFETLIPYELSSPGRFDIIVREYSDTPGKWGIWDMIITDKRVDRIEIIKPEASEKMKEIDPKIFK